MDHKTLRSAILAVFPAAPWEFDSTWNGARCKLPGLNRSIEIWDQSGFDAAVLVGIELKSDAGGIHVLWEERCKYDDLPIAMQHLRAHLQQQLDEAAMAVKGLTAILPTFRKLTIVLPDSSKVEIDDADDPDDWLPKIPRT